MMVDKICSFFLLLMTIILTTLLLAHTYKHLQLIFHSEPKVITKTVIQQDETAVKLLSEITGQDCSNISVYSMDGVTITAYTACKGECNANPEVTASMTPSRVGLIAASRDFFTEVGLTYGQMIIIPPYGVFQIQDTMNKKYRRRMDILHATKKAAKLFGVKHGKILWIGARNV